MAVTDVGGYLEYVARDRKSVQDSKVGGSDTRTDETIFEENLKLEIDGYVYHPNFMEFALGGLFGLIQRDYRDITGDRRRTSGADGTVVEFDFEGSFLRKKNYPGTVFARRYRALEPRPFQPSLEVTTSSYGVNWRYISAKFPTSLRFTHTDVRLDPRSDFERKGRQTSTLARFETGYNFSDHNVLSFIYEYNWVKEEPFELSYDSDELTLRHRFNFGQHRLHRLDSELNYLDQRGTINIERIRLREYLRLEHSETLRSWYVLEGLDRSQGSRALTGGVTIDERSYSFSGTLEHELYESLISRFTAYGRTQRFGGGLDIDRVGGEIDFDYRKKNRWGVLLGDYRIRYELEDRGGGDQRAEVLDETHKFQDPEPAVLNNTNIDIGSILITAEDRTTVYRRSRDYTVHTVGDRVEIRRVPTGRITDAQTVLIDYQFDVGGDFELDTLTHHFAIRQNFEMGLSPYYRLLRQDQTITPKAARGVTPEDITAHTVGVEFRRGALRLSGEYEDHDSTVNPFEAVRLNASYARHFKTGATGTVKARWSDLAFGAPNERDTRYFSVEGRYRHPIARNFTVEGAVLYRNENDSWTGRDEGVEVDFALEWSVRETEVRLTYEFGRFDYDFARNEFSSLYVQVKRRF